MITIDDAVFLVNAYGENYTLGELLKRIQGDKIYKCPACMGRGKITEEYNAYPSGLPDSGWVYEAGYRDKKCTLCDGHGYTNKKYVPKMVQEGWVESNDE
jgi:rubrerythrin